MPFELGSLAQVIHVTDDLQRARWLYGEVFAGLCYYEGYSPYEKRDASIYAIGDLTVEPMAPSPEVGALEMPVGRFLTRFGPRLHSVAINTTGVLELAAHLVAHGVRVVGPGGVPIDEMPQRAPVSIYTHPRDTHFLIELVDFGAPMMPSSPRLAADWDPGPWARGPLGVLGLSHVTALVRDVDAALGFFTDVLGAPVVRPSHTSPSGSTASIRLGTETVVQLFAPADDSSPAGVSLANDGEGLFELCIRVHDLDAAAEYLTGKGVGTTRRNEVELALTPGDAAGGRVVLTTADVAAHNG
jgi:catechol 2,3-dioxygenase-like lactoylglutathione lyase family enzyme